MKKGISFVWVEACQKVFEDIKEYLIEPPILIAPISEKLFLLYASYGPFFRRSGTEER